MIAIRAATEGDFEALYALGRATPELRVSASQEFMDADEFRLAMSSPTSIFLVAESDDDVAGFLYANTDDKDAPLQKRWACLVYLAVAPHFRGQGLATRLHDACVERLKLAGTTHLYGWAHAQEGGAIRRFMRKHGFTEGHRYVWVDKEI